MRLLIVEDDPHIAELLEEGLGEDGYACDRAGSAGEGASLARLFPYALIILDVMLPEGQDAGYELGRELRSGGVSTPILYLSARGTVPERVAGLDAGGDDYLAKPFALRELRARVRAQLRRSSGASRNLLQLPGGWQMDLGGRTVWRGEGGWKAERSLDGQAELTRREFGLLELMALHPGRAFSRQDIIERLWSGETGVEPKVIDVYVSTLRRKLGEGVIDTVRGLGYRLGRTEGAW